MWEYYSGFRYCLYREIEQIMVENEVETVGSKTQQNQDKPSGDIIVDLFPSEQESFFTGS